jgi:hypothetical protein
MGRNLFISSSEFGCSTCTDRFPRRSKSRRGAGDWLSCELASAQNPADCNKANDSMLQRIERQGSQLAAERLLALRRRAQHILDTCRTGHIEDPRALFVGSGQGLGSGEGAQQTGVEPKRTSIGSTPSPQKNHAAGGGGSAGGLPSLLPPAELAARRSRLPEGAGQSLKISSIADGRWLPRFLTATQPGAITRFGVVRCRCESVHRNSASSRQRLAARQGTPAPRAHCDRH